jgi:hypothetical protein
MARHLDEFIHTHRGSIPTMATVFEDIGTLVSVPCLDVEVIGEVT